MRYSKPFPTTEYEERVQTVKQSMDAAGFDAWSFYTPQAVLIHQEEVSPVWFGRAIDAMSYSRFRSEPRTPSPDWQPGRRDWGFLECGQDSCDR